MRTIMTIIIGISLLLACKNKSREENDTVNYLTFQTAQKAKDYQTAVAALTAMAATDTAKYPWVYDSLALYHYFYLNIPGLLKNPYTALHYCETGLTANKNNDFLKEMQARLWLIEQKDSLALLSFDNLWKKTSDYTHLWSRALILLYTGKVQKGVEIIDEALKSQDIDKKTVRFINPDMGVRETVNAKAAFLYLNARLKLEENNLLASGEYLQECLKIDPNFVHAKSAVYEIQKKASQGGDRR